MPKPEIKTSFGAFVIVDVGFIERYPPDCDLDKKIYEEHGCLVVPEEDARLLQIKLESANADVSILSADVDVSTSNNMKFIDECRKAYLTASDDSQVNFTACGPSGSKSAIEVFSVPKSAHGFKLFWPDNPPLALDE